MARERRGRIELIMALLRACRPAERKTALFRAANMNFRQGERYLETCLEEGLVQRDGDHYVLTETGGEALTHWRHVECRLPQLEDGDRSLEGDGTSPGSANGAGRGSADGAGRDDRW